MNFLSVQQVVNAIEAFQPAQVMSSSAAATPRHLIAMAGVQKLEVSAISALKDVLGLSTDKNCVIGLAGTQPGVLARPVGRVFLLAYAGSVEAALDWAEEDHRSTLKIKRFKNCEAQTEVTGLNPMHCSHSRVLEELCQLHKASDLQGLLADMHVWLADYYPAYQADSFFSALTSKVEPLTLAAGETLHETPAADGRRPHSVWLDEVPSAEVPPLA